MYTYYHILSIVQIHVSRCFRFIVGAVNSIQHVQAIHSHSLRETMEVSYQNYTVAFGGFKMFQISVSFPQVIDPKWPCFLLAFHTSNHQFNMAWKGHVAVTTWFICASWIMTHCETAHFYHQPASVWKECFAGFKHHKATRHLQLIHLNVIKQLEIFILSGLV